ncbi:2-amino-4-hydroxy-6-hydroxymethyldihydropteridine diphosphokinase [Thermodesulfomicrobium sp. WS]|uniref:2-amino-4-hydroxy-6- hydroxymethyldihydropteridine diphosphokinase n=1 Tax=Thermodesulfomicrobium sp. WS TaxID=3004129 RepID=UPI00249073E4|nr:2-amino-4-hydroxy-6-hydroxymethyldihydropteridine diphosphokinase [Thermodesulfomicrobium sp. WS]BDV01276.1 2-amino-4-hydroxy-6-hydroxymethyldihydropteridine diphosphokinase [Thermodesulfomicrobium sp. WS]
MTTTPCHAFLGLGSNKGESERLLAVARDRIARIPQTTLVAASSVYRTQPQLYADQPWFWNQVVRVQTALSPGELLAATQTIEAELGRNRRQEERFGPRTMDIDILMFGDLQVQDEVLTIPHPRLVERAFMLVPLLELEPQAILPDGTVLREALDHLSYTWSNDQIWQAN